MDQMVVYFWLNHAGLSHNHFINHCQRRESLRDTCHDACGFAGCACRPAIGCSFGVSLAKFKFYVESSI